MAIEVIEQGKEHWSVYWSMDKTDRCCCTPEWSHGYPRSGCGEVHYVFMDQSRANAFAAYLRFAPNGYENAVNHWTFVNDDPWVRACGCHEDERHYWIEECDFAKRVDEIRFGEWEC